MSSLQRYIEAPVTEEAIPKEALDAIHGQFLREDQLLQHINGVHVQQKLSKKVCKEVLSLFKTDNRDMHMSTLSCGFCSRISNSWLEREDHVFEHLKEGICKSVWLVGRLSAPSDSSVHGDEHTTSDMDTSNKTSSRITWSCEYLHDHHALFKTTGSLSDVLVSECKLCPYPMTGGEDEVKYRADTRRHGEWHGLRLCSQTQFSTIGDFINHLVMNHGAIRTCLDTHTLDSWMFQQELTWQGEQCVAGPARILPRRTICNYRKQDLLDGFPCL